MYSPFYQYASIHTPLPGEAFPTNLVEDFLNRSPQVSGRGGGCYASENGHLTLQLMQVQDFNSWNSNDYNPEWTNFISIILTKPVLDHLEEFADRLAGFLTLPLIWDED